MPRPDLTGILPVVISGGRPLLSHRCTRRLLPYLEGVTADPVWLVRDDRAAEYERDQYEVATFSKEAAQEYAATHWTSPEPFTPESFMGGFTEREWACRLAAERGCWAVLQLDDNIRELRLFTGLKGAARIGRQEGGLGLYVGILAALTLATNARMTGANLSSVNPSAEPRGFVRAGFPYSLFLERVDLPDREPYFGPFEDDILHAYQYMSRPDDATAAVVLPLLYLKDHTRSAKTGMRQHYGHTRSAGLQMISPEAVTVGMRTKHSNGKGEGRIFHKMGRAAIRTPLVIRDQELFDSQRDRIAQIRDTWIIPAIREGITDRLAKNARKADRLAALRAHVGTGRTE